MLLKPDVAEFVIGPVMMIIGTCDASNVPDIGRAVGCRVLPDGENIEIFVSAWQSPRTVSNIRETARAAVTFVQPSDYTAYQVKGTAGTRMATDEDRALCRRYMADATNALGEQGVPPSMTAMWLTDRELAAITLKVESLSIKTPGGSAGTVIGPEDDLAPA